MVCAVNCTVDQSQLLFERPAEIDPMASGSKNDKLNT